MGDQRLRFGKLPSCTVGLRGLEGEGFDGATGVFGIDLARLLGRRIDQPPDIWVLAIEIASTDNEYAPFASFNLIQKLQKSIRRILGPLTPNDIFHF